MRRHTFLKALSAVALAWSAAGAALAQEGTIKIIVGYPAGAVSDALTRAVAEQMAVTLKQTVIVENKPGAGGRIANELVKAPPPRLWTA